MHFISDRSGFTHVVPCRQSHGGHGSVVFGPVLPAYVHSVFPQTGWQW